MNPSPPMRTSYLEAPIDSKILYTIQVFVCRNGDNGMTYEHSPAEAVALMKVTDHALHCA